MFHLTNSLCLLFPLIVRPKETPNIKLDNFPEIHYHLLFGTENWKCDKVILSSKDFGILSMTISHVQPHITLSQVATEVLQIRMAMILSQ